MKKQILAIGISLALLSCKQEAKEPTVADTLQSYTIQQMMDNESVGGGSFSPDKSKLLVHSNRSGIYNLYTVPAEGGEFTPVTASDSSSVFAISYFPKDERKLFRMDNNGDEIYHIHMMDEDGTQQDLTP
ncbi:MAG: S9 family peptidase, partial [Robiginitalea sp.]|nr:S9 family peptidase [Robiginitalea sp.]